MEYGVKPVDTTMTILINLYFSFENADHHQTIE